MTTSTELDTAFLQPPRSAHRERVSLPPAQLLVQSLLRHQLLESGDSHEPGPFEVLNAQAVVAVGREHLLCARPHGPPGRQLGERVRKLGEAHTVAALVGPSARRERYARLGDDLLDDLRDIADLVVLGVTADVISLAVHLL